MKKEIYAMNVMKGIIQMKMVDAHIQKIVKYLTKENALSAKKIIFWILSLVSVNHQIPKILGIVKK